MTAIIILILVVIGAIVYNNKKHGTSRKGEGVPEVHNETKDTKEDNKVN